MDKPDRDLLYKVEKVIKKNVETEVVFFISYISKTETSEESRIGRQLAKLVGVKDKELPTVMGIKGHKDKTPTPFKYYGEISDFKNLDVFIQHFKANKLTPFMKSQDRPADNSGALKIITGNTYSDIVNDENREVLVNICAPLHDLCIAFRDAYKSFADQVESVDSLKVGTIDIIENDIEGREVKAVPELLFYPKGLNKVPEVIPFKHSLGAAEIKKNGLEALQQWMVINSDGYQQAVLRAVKAAG